MTKKRAKRKPPEKTEGSNVEQTPTKGGSKEKEEKLWNKVQDTDEKQEH